MRCEKGLLISSNVKRETITAGTPTAKIKVRENFKRYEEGER